MLAMGKKSASSRVTAMSLGGIGNKSYGDANTGHRESRFYHSLWEFHKIPRRVNLYSIIKGMKLKNFKINKYIL